MRSLVVCLYKCSATQSNSKLQFSNPDRPISGDQNPTLQLCVFFVVVYLLFYFSSRLQLFYYVSFRMILDMLLPS